MSDITSEDLELFHYGIKGMKWGVRRKEGPDGTVSSNVKSKDKEPGRYSLKNPKVRRAAIAGVAVTGIVAGAFVATHYGKKLSGIDPKTVRAGAEKAREILERPTDIIYLSKAHKGSGVTKGGVETTTFNFISKGNTKDYFDIFDKAGLNESDAPPFRKMPNGDVAALFGDLLGRVDAAGREVPHAVLVPAEKAVGLNSVEDVISKYGPELESRYQAYLERERAAST